MATKEISIVLRAKNAMGRGLARARKAFSAFGKGIGRFAKKLGKRLSIAFLAAGAAIAATLAKSVQAYAIQEKAEKSLTSAINARGEKGEELIGIMKREASAIQDQTGAADEQTLATMAQLSQLGVLTDNLADAAKATIALKSVGLEGASAQRAVAMAFAGNYSMLQRYVPALRDATTEQEKATIVSKLFTRGYKQQADEMDTVAGQWKNLKGRIGDAMEAVGSAIANSDGLKNALQRAADKVKVFGQAVSDWVKGEQFEAIQTSVTGIVDAMTSGGEGRREAIGAVAGLFMAAIKDGGEWAANKFVEAAKTMGKIIADAGKGLVKKHGKAVGQTFMRNIVPGAALGMLLGKDDPVKKTEDQKEQTKEISRTQIALEKLRETAAKYNKEREKTPEVKTDIEPKIPSPPTPEVDEAAAEKLAAQKKAAEEKLALEKKLADDIKKLEDEKKQAQIDAQQKVLDDAKKKADEQQKLAEMRVQDFIDAAKKEKNIEKEKAEEAERAEELQGRVDRGVKLSKKDQEFLDAFNKIQEAGKAGGGLAKADQAVKDAQKKLEDLQGEGNRHLKQIEHDLGKQRAELKQLLTMQ